MADRDILRLLQAWLRAPVVVERADGKKEIQGGRKTRRGTPQGGVISPLLANLYLHELDRTWQARGLEEQLHARLIRYADDFVVACRGTAAAALAEVRSILADLDLTLNDAKTRLVDLRRDAIRFLGFHIRVAQSPRTGGTFPLVGPSPKALQHIRTTLKGLTGRNRAPRPDALVIAAVNQVVRGWVGYFHYRNCYHAMASLKRYLERRVRLFLGRKVPAVAVGVPHVPRLAPVRAPGPVCDPHHGRLDALGVCLAVKGLGQPDAGKLHVRLDEGALVLRHARASEAPPTERGGNR